MKTDKFCFYLKNRLIQASQTGGQRYSDTSPFIIPWLKLIWGYYTPPLKSCVPLKSIQNSEIVLNLVTLEKIFV